MRYYAVKVYGAPSSFPNTPDGFTWTSHPNGVRDPGAQEIEFHIEEYNASMPTDGSVLTVHGVSFQQIKQPSDLNGKTVAVWGGMMPGLPIANYQAAHRGLLVVGKINRCWGNWIGTDMSIGMQIVVAGAAQAEAGVNSPAPSGGGGGGNGGGGNGAGSQAVRMQRTGQPAEPVRYLRSGGRSLDRMTLPRGQTSPIRRGPYITPRSPAAPMAPLLPGTAGTISGPTIGGSQFPTGVGASFGAATSELGGVITSFFGGGGGAAGLQAPINLIHNMMPNMPLSSAIQQTLSTAFPMGGTNVNISPLLKLAYQDAGVYQNMQQYAGYVKNLSENLLGILQTTGYPGVNMTSKGNTLNVWDGTSPGPSKTIGILDLIGQPTWLGPNEIQIKTVLRGDLTGGDPITLPPTLVTTGQEFIVPPGPNTPEQRTINSFSGTFIIRHILYIGDFRSPDGNGWCAIYNCFAPGGGAAVPGAGTAV